MQRGKKNPMNSKKSLYSKTYVITRTLLFSIVKLGGKVGIKGGEFPLQFCKWCFAFIS